jgi:hypothetical protein
MESLCVKYINFWLQNNKAECFVFFLLWYISRVGLRDGAFVWGTSLQTGGRGFDFLLT